MLMSNLKKISIVIPSFNEETNIDVMINTLHEVMQKLPYEYRLVFVDDGSSDNSLKKLETLSKADSRLFFAALSRNFGHQMH